MFLLKNFNLLLRFILELCLAAAAFYIGFHLSSIDILQWGLGLGLLTGVIIIWSIYIAPRSERRLPLVWRVAVELILFAGAAIGLFTMGQAAVAWTLVAGVIANEALLLVLEQE